MHKLWETMESCPKPTSLVWHADINWTWRNWQLKFKFKTTTLVRTNTASIPYSPHTQKDIFNSVNFSNWKHMKVLWIWTFIMQAFWITKTKLQFYENGSPVLKKPSIAPHALMLLISQNTIFAKITNLKINFLSRTVKTNNL